MSASAACEGRKSLADIAPLAVAYARGLRVERPRMSYREIAAALQAEGYTTRKGTACGAAAIQRMLED